MNYRALFVFGVGLLLLIGCKGQAPRDQPHRDGEFIEDAEPTAESAQEHFKPAERDHFAEIDGKVVDGKYTSLGKTEAGLTPQEIRGRNAWMLWTGGNELFWDWLAVNGYDSVDFLKLIDSDERSDRFQRAGLINEPGMRAPSEAETKAAFGIRYDRPTDDYYSDTNSPYKDHQPDPKVYGYPTGIVGMRLFKNPAFGRAEEKRWMKNKDRFYDDQAYSSDPRTVKPFVVGVSCAICHVSHHPLNPPTDPENPKWENISSTIGAQYLRVRGVFGNTLKPDSYLYQVIDSQMPGTIDTSLIATDHINNSNTMNAIFGLESRVTRSLYSPPETLSDESYGPEENPYPGLWGEYEKYGEYDYPPGFADYYDQLEGNPRHVPRVLVDGSDSLGAWVALCRVYLNIGTYHQQWARTHNMVLGYRDQDPFTLKDCEDNSIYWHATKIRVDSMAAYFLKATDPMLLKDAIVNNEPVEKFPPTPAVKEHAAANEGYKFSGLPTDPALKKGRAVFAKGCIACHSSKQPDYKGLDVRDNEGTLIEANTLSLEDRRRLTRVDGELPPDYARWAQHVVEIPSFWDDNYLSIDMRIPVTITETNSARAMGTNALDDHVWEDFASNTYKDLPSVGKINYRDPFSGAINEYDSPAGGPGYYRVPTLISAWATAPFLHNNALGKFNNDPSVKGRLDAFDDAINKLLSPEKRFEGSHDLAKLDSSEVRSEDELLEDGGLIWRTSERSHFFIRGHQIPSFLYGFTGFTRFWVRVIPWIPSLALVLVGLKLLLGTRIKRIVGGWLARVPRLKFVFMLGTAIFFIVMVLLSIGFGYLLYQYFTTLRMIETGSGWAFPWATVQIAAITILLAAAAFALLLKSPRLTRLAAVLCLVFSILFALGFGLFAAGKGGDLRIGPFPKGMPVNLVINVNRHANKKDLIAAGQALTKYFIEHREAGDASDDLHDFEHDVAPHLMNVSNCPDLVLDRGHDYEFIQHLTQEEKDELILLIKTF